MGLSPLLVGELVASCRNKLSSCTCCIACVVMVWCVCAVCCCACWCVLICDVVCCRSCDVHVCSTRYLCPLRFQLIQKKVPQSNYELIRKIVCNPIFCNHFARMEARTRAGADHAPHPDARSHAQRLQSHSSDRDSRHWCSRGHQKTDERDRELDTHVQDWRRSTPAAMVLSVLKECRRTVLECKWRPNNCIHRGTQLSLQTVAESTKFTDSDKTCFPLVSLLRKALVRLVNRTVYQLLPLTLKVGQDSGQRGKNSTITDEAKYHMFR